MRTSVAAAGAAVVTVGAAAIEFAQTHSPGQAAAAGLAGLIAAGVALLAVSLPGLGLRGLVIGGFFVGAGMLSWTFIDNGRVVWATLVLEGIVFAVWSFPWFRDLRRLPRLGMAWLGLAYWILGIAGAVLVGHLGVGAQRIAYAGVFGLAALTVVATVKRRTDEDITLGIAAAFLLVIVLLLVAGSGNVFDAVHPVPGGPQGALWGSHMQARFWGGPALLYHPNSIGVISAAAAVRIGLAARVALWQRLAAAATAGFMIYLVVSRTALLYAGVAAVLHALVLWRRRGTDLPTYRRTWLAALVPVLLVATVYFGLGGFQFATQTRYGNANATTALGAAGSDPTSGRMETWREVGREWAAAGWAEKAFGDAKTARAVVYRGANSPKLTTDNAAVGALRRGGVLGVLAFLVGLALMLLHALVGARTAPRGPTGSGDVAGAAGAGDPSGAAGAGEVAGAAGAGDPSGAAGAGEVAGAAGAGGWWGIRGRVRGFLAGRRTPPAWFTVAAVSSVSTIATSDWLLGGTGGTLWILLLAGEATLLYRPVGSAPAPAAEPGSTPSGDPSDEVLVS